MTDPRHIAISVVGSIEWDTETRGYCACPGSSLHTTRTKAKDCRIHIDGAPTLFCVHASCQPAVAATNKLLRQKLSARDWQIVLPSGKILRSGDIITPNGIIARELVKEKAKLEGKTPSDLAIISQLTDIATCQRGQILEKYRWPLSDIERSSPRLMGDRPADEQFRAWLNIWPKSSYVWIGDVFSSGKPEHASHFRQAAEWALIGPVVGNYTCASSFKPGTYQRSNLNTNGTQFLVVESDQLDKDTVGAVFMWLNRACRYNLHAIVDTAGKSLHGWFDRPRSAAAAPRLKAVIGALLCDPRMFTFSQPVRVPGAFRNGKLQRLVWLKECYA